MRAIRIGDPRHLLKGLVEGAFNILSSHAFGNYMLQLLTKSKASNYDEGIWEVEI
ncbi:MAG: hypothetical protein LBU10_00625 [Endomicrobium sp.]|nr:hypothetical protein [Endomicrobium sp.]